MRLSLKEHATVSYWLGSVLLLNFLNIISIPFVLLCAISLLLSGLFLSHLLFRDYTHFVHPGFVSKERYYLQILTNLVTVDQSILNRLFSIRKPSSNLLLVLRLAVVHYVDLLSHSLLLLYASLRYNLLVFSSILDQCLLLVFLVSHSAFEAAIPAHGAIIGTSSPLFALLSCLLAGSVEVIGEHDPLVLGDCCTPTTSIDKQRIGKRFITSFVALAAFFSHYIFATVVLDECLHPLLSLSLPALLPNSTPHLICYGLNFLLSVSYAVVFSKMIVEALHTPRSWSISSTMLFFLLSILSGSVMFFEFHAHISLSISYLPSLLLSSFMSFTRAGLLMLAAHGEHRHPHSQQMYAFEWMKFFASLAVGIIAGHEFYEFLLVMHLAPSFTFLAASVLTAVISGFVVEGAFFGKNQQNDSLPKGLLFTPLFSYLLPQTFYSHITDVVLCLLFYP